MSKRKAQGEHDSMIEFLADALYARNLTDVRADISGYKKPVLITWPGSETGFVPDATAYFMAVAHLHALWLVILGTAVFIISLAVATFFLRVSSIISTVTDSSVSCQQS